MSVSGAEVWRKGASVSSKTLALLILSIFSSRISDLSELLSVRWGEMIGTEKMEQEEKVARKGGESPVNSSERAGRVSQGEFVA